MPTRALKMENDKVSRWAGVGFQLFALNAQASNFEEVVMEDKAGNVNFKTPS